MTNFVKQAEKYATEKHASVNHFYGKEKLSFLKALYNKELIGPTILLLTLMVLLNLSMIGGLKEVSGIRIALFASVPGWLYLGVCVYVISLSVKEVGIPYSVHLKQVVDVAERYLYLVPKEKQETILAACWCHDIIEDCRETYNDLAKEMGVEVADIVYAVSNEKGKTRKERANEKYYIGIRTQPGASYVKICDRIANIEAGIKNRGTMVDKYRSEAEEFKKELWNPEYQEMFNYLDCLLFQTI